MKKQVRLLLYVIFFTGILMLALGFHSIENAWAGPDHQTVPTATLDLTEAVSDLALYVTATPAAAEDGAVRARLGLIVAIVAGGLLLLAGGTVAGLYWFGAFRERGEENEN
ncbi:MAG: hypothetical protein U9Q82_01340 [Chloroflexota bacterium]|nr:hypothetical protein [Chloroflexota bacterium]